MAPDKLKPNDPRVQHLTAVLNGQTYHYLLARPITSPHRATVLLLHGFPDLSLGWRYQVPFLVSLGLQVVVPDMLGYGQTDAPESAARYSLKHLADDVAALAAHAAPGERVMVGGHDWGAAAAWRTALWHGPDLVRGVFSLCVPYAPPARAHADLAALVADGRLPNFAYQLQFRGPDVEREVAGPARLRGFLNALFGSRWGDGEGEGEGEGGAAGAGFSVEHGVRFEGLEALRRARLLDEEELEFYVREYGRHGMRGPLNWYRQHEFTFEEERVLVEQGRTRITVPSLMIAALKDTALPPHLGMGMAKHFDNLVRKEVDTHHWAQLEAPDEVNGHIKEFVESILGSDPGVGPKI